MFDVSPETIAAWAATQSQTTASGTMGPGWSAWQDMINQYQDGANAAGLPKLDFWLVIALPGKDYSERIEWHEDLPMLMPTSGSGVLTGLAQSNAELNKMLTEDSGNVHLTYKVKIQGQEAWRDLLEFLAEHGMLEKEC